jgi:hypothetical protein
VSYAVNALRDRLFQKVKETMRWTNEKTELWWSTPNPYFGETTPNDLIVVRPEKAEKIINALIEEGIK